MKILKQKKTNEGRRDHLDVSLALEIKHIP